MGESRLIFIGNIAPPAREDLLVVARQLGVRALYMANEELPTQEDLVAFSEAEPIFPDGFGQADFADYNENVRGDDTDMARNSWRRLGDLFVDSMQTRKELRNDEYVAGAYEEYRTFPLRTHGDPYGRRKLPERPYENVRYDFGTLVKTLDWMDEAGFVRGQFHPTGFGFGSYIIWRAFATHHQNRQLHQVIGNLLKSKSS